MFVEYKGMFFVKKAILGAYILIALGVALFVMRKKVCLYLEILIIICSFLGVFLSLVTAVFDGYSHWSRRMLYFTLQSNVWVFVSAVLSVVFINKKQRHSIYMVKYIFTVSISLTGLVFCTLLAPFADQSYRPWALNSWLTHVIVPLLVIVDFFIDNYNLKIKKEQVFLSLIPPLCYFLITTLLFFMRVDFGRGVNYPYFFFNYLSPAGIFGFSNTPPFIIGSFYWIVLLFIIVLAFGFLYSKIHNLQTQISKSNNKSRN